MYILTNDTDKEQYCGRHNKQPRPPCPSIPSRQEHCNWSLAPLVPTDHDDTLTTCLSIPVVATVRPCSSGRLQKHLLIYTTRVFIFGHTLRLYTHWLQGSGHVVAGRQAHARKSYCKEFIQIEILSQFARCFTK